MPDPARARRLAKRIATIVASAIEYEIKDPRLAGVTITDAKVTGDLHDATLFYTVLGRSLDEEPDYAGRGGCAGQRQGCAAYEGGCQRSACGSLRRWRSNATPSPTRRTGWRNSWLAPAPQMRIWPEFEKVPSTPARQTRTV